MINGKALLKKKCEELKINLTMLIAQTTIWANPDAVKQLQAGGTNPNALWIDNCRRKKLGEKRRTLTTEKCFLDDNTKANTAFKKAIGQLVEGRTFTTCHIYEDSCYDKNYHTSICNLVLIPSGIYSLADNETEVINALKYRSFDLYGFYINQQPQKPDGYDGLDWRDPEPYTEKIKRSIEKRKFEYV